MDRKNKIKLGYAPTRRDTKDFDLKYAYERRDAVRKKVEELSACIGNVEIVDIDWLNDEGLLVYPEDADKVAERFISQKVDAVFTPHCNFGAEGAVARLGSLVKSPLLLWGPRDEMPPSHGARQTDSQCGLFASSMVLERYNVPFQYIENCRTESDVFARGFEDFIRVASVVKAFKNLRIGQISLRPRTFMSVKVNEAQLLENFGIDVVSIDTTEITSEIQNVLDSSKDSVKLKSCDICSRVDASSMSKEGIEKIAALEIAITNVANKYECTAMASECWRTFSTTFGIMPCFAFGDLAQQGLPVACEGDVYGAVSSALLLAAAMGSTPPFLADMTIRHPENDNAELLWHCGPFPSSLAKEGVSPRIENCLGQFEIRGGDITVCRFGESHGKYKLFSGEGKGVDGPATNGNYVWFETDDWPKWERKFIYGPYIHHISGIHGKFARSLGEAVKYMNGVEADNA
jgi:L-fucose isomerase-like protein